MTDAAGLQPWIDAGIYDPDHDDAQLAEVLDFFTLVGVEARDFVDVERDDLIAAVGRAFLRPDATLTAEEVRVAAGVPAEAFERMVRASDYRMDGTFTPTDLAAFQSFAFARTLFTDEALEDFARVLSSAMAKVADATSALFRIDVAPRIEAAGGSDLDYAKQNHLSAQMVDGLLDAMRAFFLNQLIGAVALSDAARQASTSGAVSTVKLAVGFVDLVGYTHRAASTDPDELAGFIIDFERSATRAVLGGGGRLVKLIGDEIMFVAADAPSAVAIASTIVRSFVDDNARPRGGVAAGEVIGLGGDYYGPVVNLAARLVDQAVPGEVLVDAAVVEGCEGGTQFEPAGRRQIKGLDEPVPLWALMP